MYKDSETVKFKKIPGRPSVITTPQKLKAIKKHFDTNPSSTIAAASEKLKIPNKLLAKVKVHKLGIVARVKKTVPKYVNDQENRVQKGCKKMYRKMSSKVVVMDDETYVNLDPHDTPGRKFYHSSNPADVEYGHKVKMKCKFPEKILVWQAMDSFGNISTSYFCKGTINANLYKNECLKKRLLPFIRKYHKINDILFWPDMATSHYARECTTYLSSEGVDFVSKKDNAPNVPQLRPIERFWALCKRRYSDLRRQPKN